MSYYYRADGGLEGDATNVRTDESYDFEVGPEASDIDRVAAMVLMVAKAVGAGRGE